ncbi:MAG: 4'-phosphopantetheinyl transferase superfamily protein, partial [Candidatus Eremiobacteraeota bacterium]|nr:4'-phosphopantetheinyl transferase superfamily protein [Candidatus Eremiobacteraeota bacterium]
MTWDGILTAVHAWQVRPSDVRESALRKRWLSRLPAEERIEYERFRTHETRTNYLFARVLCRTTLSKYADTDPSEWRFGKALHGKPIVVGPGRFKSLRFSLSHTNDLIICAVTRAGEVGVDAEDTSLPVDVGLVARHFFSGPEKTRLARLPGQQRVRRFFEQFVLKEAYVKATG